MKKTVYTCDRCKKEIAGDPVKICMEVVDRQNGDFSNNFPFPDIREYDFCDSCGEYIAGQIRRFCKKGAPAINDPDAGAAVKETAATSKPSPGTAARRIDTGKVMALKTAGWTVKAIAEEMGCSEVTVYNVMKKLKTSESDIQEGQSAGTLTERRGEHCGNED